MGFCSLSGRDVIAYWIYIGALLCVQKAQEAPGDEKTVQDKAIPIKDGLQMWQGMAK
jgi:hypothetical protein